VTIPHILRHTFASLSIERGANIKVVSQLLGHSQVGTNLYTHFSEGHVREVFKMCHPMAKKKLSDEEILTNRMNS
jgi:integrase/recombinase XerD